MMGKFHLRLGGCRPKGAGSAVGNSPAAYLAWRVAGFVLKDAPVGVLAVAIRRWATGVDIIDSTMTAQALRAASCPLSLVERDILLATAESASTAEIAGKVCLSEGTVRNKVSKILGIVGARNSAEAIRIALESSWL